MSQGGSRTEEEGSRSEEEQEGSRTEEEGGRTEEDGSRTEVEDTRTEQEGRRAEENSSRTEEKGSRTEQGGSRTEVENSITDQEGRRTEENGSRTEEEEDRRTEVEGNETEQEGSRTEEKGSRTEEEEGKRTGEGCSRTKEEEGKRTGEEGSRTEVEGSRTESNRTEESGSLVSSSGVVQEEGEEGGGTRTNRDKGTPPLTQESKEAEGSGGKTPLDSEEAQGFEGKAPLESEEAQGSEKTPLESEEAQGSGGKTPLESEEAQGSEGKTPLESEEAQGSEKTPLESEEEQGSEKKTPLESEEMQGSEGKAPLESEETQGSEKTPLENEEEQGSEGKTPLEIEEAQGSEEKTPLESEEAQGSDGKRVLGAGARLWGRVRCALVRQKLDQQTLQGKDWQRAVIGMNGIEIKLSMKFTSREFSLKRMPSRKQSGVFGVKIAVVTKREHSKVPLIVRQCVEEIERRGLEEVGIYRVSGVATDIQTLKAAFDSNNKDVSVLMSEMDVNAIAGTLKLYFRELPEPLFTDELYRNFTGGIGLSDSVAKESCMLNLLLSLPEPNLLTFLFLLDHLKRVAENECVNKMSFHNLATVFGPTLMRPSEKDTKTPMQPIMMTESWSLEVMSQVQVLLYFLQLETIPTPDSKRQSLLFSTEV